MGPTLAGFIAFIQNIMGVPTAALPPDSPIIVYAYDQAFNIVNPLLQCVPSQSAVWSPYAVAIYNLGGHLLLEFAPDQPGQNYFAQQRNLYKLTGFTAGVIQSTSDQGTSASMLVADAFKGLTLRDLSTIRTPYGRAYMSYAQDYGTIWGIS